MDNTLIYVLWQIIKRLKKRSEGCQIWKMWWQQMKYREEKNVHFPATPDKITASSKSLLPWEALAHCMPFLDRARVSFTSRAYAGCVLLFMLNSSHMISYSDLNTYLSFMRYIMLMTLISLFEDTFRYGSIIVVYLRNTVTKIKFFLLFCMVD